MHTIPSNVVRPIVVGLGDCKVSKSNLDEIITYSLGSCLGIALYDPVAQTGGLLHVLLPDSSLDVGRAKRQPCLFVDTGIALLFRTLYTLGAVKQRIIIKVAGGASIIGGSRFFNIGEKNYDAFIKILKSHGLRISGEDVGGHAARTLSLRVSDGKCLVVKVGSENIIL